MSRAVREAFVLVGGAGTRLGSAVLERPKPVLEIAGRPFLEWLILYAISQGIDRFILCTGYRAEAVESYFGNGSRWGVTVEYSCEESPLGTAGALRLALHKTEGRTLIAMNGDSYCRWDPGRLWDEHVRASAPATLWVVPVRDCGRYGTVQVLSDGTVSGFTEKNPDIQEGLINAGIYALHRTLLESIPVGKNVSLERDVLPGLAGEGMHAVVGERPFIDIGTPESLAQAPDFMRRETASWTWLKGNSA